MLYCVQCGNPHVKLASKDVCVSKIVATLKKKTTLKALRCHVRKEES